MQHVTVVAAVERQRPAAFLIAAAVGRVEAALHAALRVQGCARYAAVDHIDHAAHGAAAVLQHAGAAQHLDALGQQRIQHHRVVGAERRQVQAGASVVEDGDAVAVLPADHRAAGIGAEVAAAHAGQAVECLAQRGLPALQQAIARELLGRRDPIRRAQRIARHDDRRQPANDVGTLRALRPGLVDQQAQRRDLRHSASAAAEMERVWGVHQNVSLNPEAKTKQAAAQATTAGAERSSKKEGRIQRNAGGARAANTMQGCGCQVCSTAQASACGSGWRSGSRDKSRSGPP
jgi:hypothetical protein